MLLSCCRAVLSIHLRLKMHQCQLMKRYSCYTWHHVFCSERPYDASRSRSRVAALLLPALLLSAILTCSAAVATVDKPDRSSAFIGYSEHDTKHSLSISKGTAAVPPPAGPASVPKPLVAPAPVDTVDVAPVCEDEKPADCPGWAASGECEKNPGFMHGSCRMSCKRCNVTVPVVQVCLPCRALRLATRMYWNLPKRQLLLLPCRY